jgi:hypothetical protein
MSIFIALASKVFYEASRKTITAKLIRALYFKYSSEEDYNNKDNA